MKFELFNDEELNLDLDPARNHYILTSGGFDSAVLLYCLSVVSKETGVRIQPIMVEPPDSHAPDFSRAQVDLVNDLLGANVPHHISVGDYSVHHSHRTMSGVLEVLSTDPQAVFWQAITKNPPVLLSAEDGTPEYRPRRVREPRACMASPFISLTKSYIVHLANRLGILDALAVTTTSCTRYSDDQRCRQCFQCRERSWGFTAMRLIDQGKR